MTVRPETIPELIRRVQAANPTWTDAELARRAGTSRTTIGTYRTSGIQRLEAEPIRALALALEVGLSVVVQAALTGMGLRVDHGGSAPEDAVQDDPDLSGRDKRMLLALIKECRRNARGTAPVRPVSDQTPDGENYHIAADESLTDPPDPWQSGESNE